jgi:hypothetical protein
MGELHYAAAAGSAESVRLLLSLGADPHAKIIPSANESVYLRLRKQPALPALRTINGSVPFYGWHLN